MINRTSPRLWSLDHDHLYTCSSDMETLYSVCCFCAFLVCIHKFHTKGS